MSHPKLLPHERLKPTVKYCSDLESTDHLKSSKQNAATGRFDKTFNKIFRELISQDKKKITKKFSKTVLLTILFHVVIDPLPAEEGLHELYLGREEIGFAGRQDRHRICLFQGALADRLSIVNSHRHGQGGGILCC